MAGNLISGFGHMTYRGQKLLLERHLCRGYDFYRSGMCSTPLPPADGDIVSTISGLVHVEVTVVPSLLKHADKVRVEGNW